MNTGNRSPAGVARRVLLVAGGLTLLAKCAADAAGPVNAASDPQAPAPQPAASAVPGGPGTSAPRTAASHSASGRPGSTRLARPEPRLAQPPHHRDDPGGLPMTRIDDGPTWIALTIDDGPNPVYTPQILRLLEKYQVIATFSMIGIEVQAYPAVAREVAAAGHTIANHTWTHIDLAWMPPAVVADQINRATGMIHNATGRVPGLFRAPYGAWSPAVLRQCAQVGMTPLDWDVDPRDWARPGVAAIIRNIMRNTRTGSIILEHDGGGNRSQTVAALKVVLPRLLAAGYNFTTP